MIFAEDIFPYINEKHFSVLYSNKSSRPNTSTSVIVNALIIKELFVISDDEIFDNLMLDPRYQMALHTTSYEEHPLSDKRLSRFRMSCYNYEQTYDVELYHACVTNLAEASEHRQVYLSDRLADYGCQHLQAKPHGADLYMYLKTGVLSP